MALMGTVGKRVTYQRTYGERCLNLALSHTFARET